VAICHGSRTTMSLSRKHVNPLRIAGQGDRLSVLCLGAHSDGIEIGAGATLLTWLGQGIRLDVRWRGIAPCGRKSLAVCKLQPSYRRFLRDGLIGQAVTVVG
jgi:hypothetical protein